MWPLAIPRRGPEVSDVIVAFDAETLRRVPVVKSEVVREFAALGNRQAARIVERIPERDGALDPEAVDRLLVTAHCEMQRLSEEFQHGLRISAPAGKTETSSAPPRR